jgi:hypothetical protein
MKLNDRIKILQLARRASEGKRISSLARRANSTKRPVARMPRANKNMSDHVPG